MTVATEVLLSQTDTKSMVKTFLRPESEIDYPMPDRVSTRWHQAVPKTWAVVMGYYAKLLLEIYL